MGLGFTQAELTALKKAIASGATEVQFADRRVKYNSLQDMIQLAKLMQAEIEGASTDLDDNPNMIQSGFSRGEE
jgi:hypothetical protein